MKKTVLITGTSSGIGRATALEFARNGWNVVATQRSPESEKEFYGIAGIKVCRLDVTQTDSIQEAFKSAVDTFGGIDAVVNNAGYGVDGVFEAMSDDTLMRQYDTNVIGLMRVTREAIRHMRPRRQGTIVQISSMGGRITFPLFSVYHGTKFAVEGFSESLHYELSPFNIRVKLVEPGLIATDFTGRSREFVRPDYTNEYDSYLAKFQVAAEKAMQGAEKPEVISRMIYQAATDGSSKLRYPVGSPAPLMIRLRKLLSDRLFFGMIRSAYKI